MENKYMKQLVILLTLCCALAQTVPAQLRPDDESGTIHKKFEAFKSRRVPAGAVLPEDIRVHAITTARRMEISKSIDNVLADQPEWKPIGPYSTAGRVKDIIVHPTDANTVYIGAAAGGVWKTTNAGATWEPLTDDANATAMGSLWFHPNNPDIIYAGTGESVTNANTFLGAGVLRSTDAGQTWTSIGLTHVGSVSRIYSHPRNPKLLMAGCMNTNAGVYKSTDEGETWTKILNESVYDMTINPLDENEWFVGVRDKGILYTSDGGTTWQPRMTGLYGSIGRTSIKQSASDPNVLYVLMEINKLAVIAKSTDKGLTWTAQYNDGVGCFFAGSCNPEASQGFYDNYISISPTNPDVCFAGGIDIYGTTNGGTTWINLTNGYADGNGQNPVHVDQHCLAFGPPGSKLIYAGNDGGMVKSTDNGNSWFVINNGLSITQFYDFDNDPTRTERSFGGTQDNGTLGTFGSMEWDSLWGGDGMVTAINHDDPDILYGNNPNGAPFRIDFKTKKGRLIVSGIDQSESALWTAPLVVNPLDGFDLMHGRTRVYRSFDGGDLWYPSSPYFRNEISALAFSPVEYGQQWAGTSAGDLWLSTNDGESWQPIKQMNLTNRFISSIQCSRKDGATAWITYGQYGAPNVWKTTNLGETWTSAWGNMPDIPVNGLAVHPEDENILFIATDIGVFATFDGGIHWMPYGKGLPRTVVTGIKLNYEFGYLRCVTHGRSAWETPLLSVAPSEPAITAPAGAEVFTGTLHTTISWVGFASPVNLEYSLDDGKTWKPLADGVSGTAYRWQIPNWPTIVARIRVTSQSNPNQQRISRSFTIVPISKGGIVQQTMVPWTPYGLAWDGKNGLWSTSFYTPYLYKLDRNTLSVLKEVRLPKSVGDSLFTDLTVDRENGIIYLHMLSNTSGYGAQVIAVDTNGTLVKWFMSAALRYPTGLEYIDGKLIALERDGDQNVYIMDTDGQTIDHVSNPCRSRYGPRGLAHDNNGNLLQVCTDFSAENEQLTNCSAVLASSQSITVESDRLLLTTNSYLINGRGIEYDERDGNMWVSDFGGSIYKVAGFNFVEPSITSVSNAEYQASRLTIRPNPASDVAVISLSAISDKRNVTVTVRDIHGRILHTVFHATQPIGLDCVFSWNTLLLANGMYTLTAEADGRIVACTPFIVYR